MVVAPQKFDVPIVQPSRQITRFVHAGAGPEGIGNKFCLRQFRTIQISTSETITCDMQLTGHTDRLRMVELVKDIDLCIVNGDADRNKGVIQL